MIKKLKYFIGPTFLLLPMMVFAQTDAISSFIRNVLGLTQRLVPTLIGLALALFLWGVLRYLFSKDGPGKKEARDFMMWGIVALFVMVSVWGLVRIVQDVIFGDNARTINDMDFPTVAVPNSR
jgi:hypothetical protein